ncbi:bacteriocin, lactococcin 972 family [Alkaliphilus metalliredigens QYMF]|uniref:Bacteriocin, lactococcin 972 family n=1 Tax=Alkaliphilus metalliredigens (strain QYMF) TaxID=293826 RepID=A6TJH4_ALKMQ|nr:lactococcin 972 family bacteriocin [Alkaliphilus metalliredigens]ABR46342.1 bacteriocin, lactococcin 972 family [Alkaliphilus metalliredigens QYMF]
MKNNLSRIFKKSVLGAVVISSLLTSQGVFASSNTPLAGGSVDLDKISGQLITPFSVQEVGGGRWEYGVGSVNVYSYYQHMTKEHSATVKGLRERKDRQLAGTEARATTAKNPLGGNRAWWNTY